MHVDIDVDIVTTSTLLGAVALPSDFGSPQLKPSNAVSSRSRSGMGDGRNADPATNSGDPGGALRPVLKRHGQIEHP